MSHQVNRNPGMKKKTVLVLLLVMLHSSCGQSVFSAETETGNVFSRLHVISVHVTLTSCCPVFIFEVKGSVVI